VAVRAFLIPVGYGVKVVGAMVCVAVLYRHFEILFKRHGRACVEAIIPTIRRRDYLRHLLDCHIAEKRRMGRRPAVPRSQRR
jgi:hypothetical protein